MNVDITNKIYPINFDLITKSLEDSERLRESLNKTDIDKIIDFSKKLEKYNKLLHLKNQKAFFECEKRIVCLMKYVLNHQGLRFKRNNHTNKINIKSILYFVIPFLKIIMDNNDHFKMKKMLLIILRLCIDKAFPYEVYVITIELLLNILANILKSNSGSFYTINDEPFNVINDIIITLSSYQEKITTENINNNIFIDVINLFDKYLFTSNYTNIILTETPIWLKLLENPIISSNNLSDNFNIENDKSLNNIKFLKEKLYTFLIKIYKLSMRDEYIENTIRHILVHIFCILFFKYFIF